MIDVVYLAYYNKELGYDISTVEKFLDTYNNRPAGMEHNLFVIAKNWTDKALYEDLSELIKRNNTQIIDLPDDGLDFGAYIRAARLLKNEYVLFLGSSMEILSDNWLAKLYKPFELDSKIQLVGPMGSWAKGLTEKFPNPHIRTTSFLIKRELFLSYTLTQKFPKIKDDTWKMEHGTNSLSSYIASKGYKFVIVDSDGKIIQPEDWPESHTYFCMGESKLLMGDKWCRHYSTLDELHQLKTAMVEWGKNVEKYPKNFVSDFSKKVNIFLPYSDSVNVISTKTIIPIYVGEINKILQTEAPQDSKGDNISEKYATYGELTAYYWVWKNFLPTANVEYVGFGQHCRFLDFNITLAENDPLTPTYIDNFVQNVENYTEDNIYSSIQGFDIVLPEKIYMNTTLYLYYMMNGHKDIIDLIFSTIKEHYPEYTQTVNDALSLTSIFLFGHFVMKKELFAQFCEWLFPVISLLERKINWNTHTKSLDILLSVFFTEVFYNIWLEHNIKNNGLKIKITSSYFINYDFQAYMASCMERLTQLQNNINQG